MWVVWHHIRNGESIAIYLLLCHVFRKTITKYEN